jgi:RHS repeat-associated protein
VYGAGGELLVEYSNVTAGPNGTESTTTWNVHLNGQIVAKRVTGASQTEGTIDRVEWLHRNHLGEAVVTDTHDFESALSSRNVQTYAEPFGSGGSDQFSGQKEDPETGLKDFGARYYNALAARWLSADSVMAHVYDPQSLNKYAYVRNDPVSLVDPDGRFGVPYHFWDENTDATFVARQDPWEYSEVGGSDDGAGGDPPSTQDWQKVNWAQLRSDAQSMAMSASCVGFLTDLFFKLRINLITGGDPSLIKPGVTEAAITYASNDLGEFSAKLGVGEQGIYTQLPVNLSQYSLTYTTAEGGHPTALYWGGQIWIYKPFFGQGQDSTSQAQTFIHETVHAVNAGQYGDLAIAQALGYKGESNDEAARFWGAEMKKRCK